MPVKRSDGLKSFTRVCRESCSRVRIKNRCERICQLGRRAALRQRRAEADFWSENRPDLRLMEAATAGGAEASESVTITLRIDPRMLARIKRLARSRYLNYQSMIKQWLSERMEQPAIL
jgi:predicted DNA binding CopG/RHH family protein